MIRFEASEMAELTNRAMARMETQGRRGTTMVTYDEIEALACTVQALRDALTQKETEETTDGG